MKVVRNHPWQVSYEEALRIQEELAGQVRTEDDLVPDEVRIIAGADVSYDRARERLYAAICVFPTLSSNF